MRSRVRAAIGNKRGLEEPVWSKAEELRQLQQRVRRLTEGESDERIKMRALVKLAGQRKSELARAYGYRDGS